MCRISSLLNRKGRNVLELNHKHVRRIFMHMIVDEFGCWWKGFLVIYGVCFVFRGGFFFQENIILCKKHVFVYA